MSKDNAREAMFSARVDYLKARDERRVASEKMSDAADAFYEALMERDGLVPEETRVLYKGTKYIFSAIKRRWSESTIEGTSVEPGSYNLLARKIKKNGEPYANTTEIYPWSDARWEVVS